MTDLGPAKLLQERVAAAMWKAEVSDHPSTYARRTPEAFKDVRKDTRDLWLHLAEAAIEAILRRDVPPSPPSPPSRARKPPGMHGKEPFSAADIDARMDLICGCAGKYDCDCVSVQNRAWRELWTEHNTKPRKT